MVMHLPRPLSRPDSGRFTVRFVHRFVSVLSVALLGLMGPWVNLAHAQVGSVRTFQAQPLAFSQVYVFGDSVSDSGNYTALAGDLPPPYDGKRLSNGPMAVEVLAEALGLTATTRTPG